MPAGEARLGRRAPEDLSKAELVGLVKALLWRRHAGKEGTLELWKREAELEVLAKSVPAIRELLDYLDPLMVVDDERGYYEPCRLCGERQFVTAARRTELCDRCEPVSASFHCYLGTGEDGRPRAAFWSYEPRELRVYVRKGEGAAHVADLLRQMASYADAAGQG